MDPTTLVIAGLVGLVVYFYEQNRKKAVVIPPPGTVTAPRPPRGAPPPFHAPPPVGQPYHPSPAAPAATLAQQAVQQATAAPVPPPAAPLGPQPTDPVADATAQAQAAGLFPQMGANLQAFQSAHGAQAVPPLRTDGVLDWRSWAYLLSYAALYQGLHQGGAVTDPTAVALANAAAAKLGTTIPAFQKGLIAGGAVFIPADGTLDYMTLAFLLTKAFDS